MLEIIIKIILLLTMILNLILIIHMLYDSHNQYKNDKIFYEYLRKNIEETHAIFTEKMKGVNLESSKNIENKK